MPHLGEYSDLQSRTQPQVAIAVGASPFTYTAADTGAVSVEGGVVTLVEVGRNGNFKIAGARSGMFALQKGDQLRVTYNNWWPTMTFARN